MIEPKHVLNQLSNTHAGVAIEYHRGVLAADLNDCNNGLARLQKKALAGLAKHLLRLAEADAIHLVQRRHGPGDYSYYAIKAAPGPCEKIQLVDRYIKSRGGKQPEPMGAAHQSTVMEAQPQ